MNAFLSELLQNNSDRLGTYLNLGNADPTIVAIIVAGIVVISLAFSALFAYTLLRTQELPKPNALAASLTLLSFIALIASIITSSESLRTIAASGIGAIAGALTTAYKFSSDDEPTVKLYTSTRTRRKIRTQEMTQTPPHDDDDDKPPCDPEDPDCQEIPEHGVNTPEEKMAEDT